MEKVADPARKMADRFSYGQYRSWPEDERWELIEGRAWLMSSPTERHQEVLSRIFTDLRVFLKGAPCRALPAPFDLLISRAEESDDEVDSVVQPDILVFCDSSKLRPDNARGAPDVVLEILSPSTEDKDRGPKLKLYERAGVREYWVIDPLGLAIDVYPLVAVPGGRMRFGVRDFRYPPDAWGRVESMVLRGFGLEPEELFKDLP